MLKLIKRYSFVPVLALGALVAVACGSSSNGAEGPPVESSLAGEVLQGMVNDVNFRSAMEMLQGQGEDILLDQASVHYADDSKTRGDFATIIPVVNHQTGKADRYAWLSYEQTVHASPIVALRSMGSTAPGYEPQCDFVYDSNGNILYRYCGGGSTTSSTGSGSGGSGGSSSCDTLLSTDTCHLGGTLAGTCVDGSSHWSYPRLTRQNYANGQWVTALDTIYSCGATAAAADANCKSYCSAPVN